MLAALALLNAPQLNVGVRPSTTCFVEERRRLSLDELTEILDAYASGMINLATLHARLLPVLVADPLQVEASNSAPWDNAHAESRLFWRLVYLFDAESSDTAAARRTARRVVRCLRQTGSAELTFELLPIILDQDRFAGIAQRHGAGIISRTSLLSVIAESGYPEHVKLWLEHASPEALARPVTLLANEHYQTVASGFETPPA